MLTYNEIVEYFKKRSLAYGVKIYHGKYGTGLVYEVKIEDYNKIEPRLVIFDTISELEQFVDNILYSDEIKTDSRELINSNPIFYLKGKVLTPQKVSMKKQEKKENEESKRKYEQYTELRGQIILDKIKMIKKEIQQLKTFIENQKERKKVLFENRKKKNLELSEAESTVNIEDDSTPNIEKLSNNENIAKLKIEYDKLLKEKVMLEEKVKLLVSLSNQSFLKRLFLSQKKIDSTLSEVSNNDVNVDIWDLLKSVTNDEITLRMLLDKYDMFNNNAEFSDMKLMIYKEFDELPIGQSHEQFFIDAEKRLESVEKKIRDRLTIEKQMNRIPTPQEEQAKIFENLKKQYDENLNDEQKDALILYNSRFFELMNCITSIPGYKFMSSMDILKKIQETPQYSRLIYIIYDHCLTLYYNNTITGEIDDSKHLRSIFEKILPAEIRNKVLEQIYFNPDDVQYCIVYRKRSRV